MLPICMMVPSPHGKTIAEFKAQLVSLISDRRDYRPIYLHIIGGIEAVENLSNDNHVIKGTSDVSALVTCINNTGMFACIEFSSYGSEKRYYAKMFNGIITALNS